MSGLTAGKTIVVGYPHMDATEGDAGLNAITSSPEPPSC